MFLEHCKDSDSEGSRENSIPNHGNFEADTEFVFPSFSATLGGEILKSSRKGSRLDLMCVLEQVVL